LQNELLRLLRHLSSSRKILITSSACSFSSPVISAGGSSEFTFFFNSHQLRWVSAKPCFKSRSLRTSSRRDEMGCTFTTVSVARPAPTWRTVASIAVALAGSRLRIRWRCLTRHVAFHRVLLFAQTPADFGINNIAAFVSHQCSVISFRYVSLPWPLLRDAAPPFAFTSKTFNRELGPSSTARRAQAASASSKAGLVRQAFLAAPSSMLVRLEASTSRRHARNRCPMASRRISLVLEADFESQAGQCQQRVEARSIRVWYSEVARK